MNEIDEMILEDRRADRTRIEAEYDEYVNRQDDENRHICIGTCVYCDAEIFEDDEDYVLNEEEETGICKDCLASKCIWR